MLLLLLNAAVGAAAECLFSSRHVSKPCVELHLAEEHGCSFNERLTLRPSVICENVKRAGDFYKSYTRPAAD